MCTCLSCRCSLHPRHNATHHDRIDRIEPGDPAGVPAFRSLLYPYLPTLGYRGCGNTEIRSLFSTVGLSVFHDLTCVFQPPHTHIATGPGWIYIYIYRVRFTFRIRTQLPVVHRSQRHAPSTDSNQKARVSRIDPDTYVRVRACVLVRGRRRRKEGRSLTSGGGGG